MKRSQKNLLGAVNVKKSQIVAGLRKLRCYSGSFCCRREITKFTVIFTVRSVYTQVCHNSCCEELFKLHLGSGQCDLCCNSLGLQRTTCTFNIRSLT